eukprot:Awhi_evm1s6083
MLHEISKQDKHFHYFSINSAQRANAMGSFHFRRFQMLAEFRNRLLDEVVSFAYTRKFLYKNITNNPSRYKPDESRESMIDELNHKVESSGATPEFELLILFDADMKIGWDGEMTSVSYMKELGYDMVCPYSTTHE